MKKIILLTVAVLAFASGYSQALWTKTTDERLSSSTKLDRNSTPLEYKLYALDLAGLKLMLQKAPSRESGIESTVIIPFPDANGQLQNYKIYESSVMEAELAEKNPDIQSYVGQGIDDKTASIHLTTTIFGLHTMTLSGSGTFYIDPYTTDLKHYIVYNKSKLTSKRSFTCNVADNETMGRPAVPSFENVTMANDGKFRTYRLAMACTIEYAAFHVARAAAQGVPTTTEAQKKAAVLAAMNVTVARVNSVYERDLSIKVVLIATNTNIIFITTDQFDNLDESGDLIDQSQSVITSTIGAANFDIGHTVSTGDGGVAALGGVCFSNAKASAITGNPSPVGDPFDIDYVAHEMGHQFGAEHTFNSTAGGSCVAQTRSAAQAVEPGSGSTIMAYAGICTQNVQLNSDAYFHTVSISQIQANIATQSTCVAGVNNNNTPPAIPNLTAYTIPKGTPFALTGSATDANGDSLTYCWEQINANGSTAMPSTTTTSGPSFRSFSPTTSPTRYFPSLQALVSGSLYEVVPNVARTMNFALTVRDNKSPNGGQTSRKDVAITLSNTGPFNVTSQSTDNISYLPGQTQAVTWNVSGTAAAPFNATNVKITLSTNGGLSYDTVLAASTPNDGSENITIPAVAAPYCRIMVEAIGNIFFAINTKNFAIGYTVTTTCTTFNSTTAKAIPDGTGNNQTGPVVSTFASSTIPVSVPAGAKISDVDVTLNVTHGYPWDLISLLIHPDATEIDLFQLICNSTNTGINATFSDGSPAVSCPATPGVITGTFAPMDTLSTLNNKNVNGNYTLILADTFAGDAGTLNSWSVKICYEITTPLGAEDFALQNFSLYPNPNNGNFTVKFDNAISNEINVGIHDMSGRQIFNKSFANTGNFSQDLQLSNVQAGVYLVTVQDGSRKETKKIVVE